MYRNKGVVNWSKSAISDIEVWSGCGQGVVVWWSGVR